MNSPLTSILSFRTNDGKNHCCPTSLLINFCTLQSSRRSSTSSMMTSLSHLGSVTLLCRSLLLLSFSKIICREGCMKGSNGLDPNGVNYKTVHILYSRLCDY